jgi:DNA modification methylase
VTPFYDDGRVALHVGHVLDVLAGLEAGSVQTCITSPPYWGLRAYGTDPQVWGGDPLCSHSLEETAPGKVLTGGTGTASAKQVSNAGSQYGNHPSPKSTLTTNNGRGPQPGNKYHAEAEQGQAAESATCTRCGAWRGELGSEPTPEQYVANIVAVFRAVRRVLRDDGTLWVNLGSSYAGSGKGSTGWNGIGDQSARQGFVGSRSAPAYGSGGKARSDYRRPDSSYPDLCDGCRDAESIRTAGKRRPLDTAALLPVQTDRDSEHQDCAVVPLGVSPLDVQASTMLESAPQPRAECSHCANCGACLDVLRSSSRDGRLCARKSGGIGDTAPQLDSSAARTSGMVPSSTASAEPPYVQPQYTSFKPKDMIPIPWMVAMALQADGWYLRCDIVWSKSNPMPESVTDRPTKSHEYLFLLSKRADYYYDAEAVREAHQEPWRGHGERKGTTEAARPDVQQNGRVRSGTFNQMGGGNQREYNPAGRNRRSVWTIPTEAYPAAHFATFPRKLVEPCILAGSRPEDVVLDPFAGSGTTLAVARWHQRRAVGIELNPEYARLIEQRLAQGVLL